MKIIEYEEKYLEDVRDLLTELEEYIVSIDKDELDQVHPEYHEKMALVDLDEINNNNGICYLAIGISEIVGLNLEVEIKHKIKKNKTRIYKNIDGVPFRIKG